MTFQIIAISSLLAFYGYYLGKMLLQKKQGIQTDQQAPTVPDRCAPPQRSIWQCDGVWKVWLSGAFESALTGCWTKRNHQADETHQKAKPSTRRPTPALQLNLRQRIRKRIIHRLILLLS